MSERCERYRRIDIYIKKGNEWIWITRGSLLSYSIINTYYNLGENEETSDRIYDALEEAADGQSGVFTVEVNHVKYMMDVEVRNELLYSHRSNSRGERKVNN